MYYATAVRVASTAEAFTPETIDRLLRADTIEINAARDAALCHSCAVRMPTSAVASHTRSADHRRAVDTLRGWSPAVTCHVFINGREMVLDNAFIFPQHMFGGGAMMYDATMDHVVLPDLDGSVMLTTAHAYDVVRFDPVKVSYRTDLSLHLSHVATTLSRRTRRNPNQVDVTTSRRALPRQWSDYARVKGARRLEVSRRRRFRAKKETRGTGDPPFIMV